MYELRSIDKDQGRRLMESNDSIQGLSTLESLRGFRIASDLTLGITRDIPADIVWAPPI
jgi:hypothetical protein